MDNADGVFWGAVVYGTGDPYENPYTPAEADIHTGMSVGCVLPYGSILLLRRDCKGIFLTCLCVYDKFNVVSDN